MEFNEIIANLPAPYYRTIYCSDALTILRGIENDSIDLLCTDPPYGIGFMGKDWDKALPDKNIWAECLRVLKPGAFAFVMSIPRADCLSRMIINLEDAGFRVDFSPIYWAYASGFPKAQNIGKQVDRRNGRVVYPEVREYLNIQRKLKGLSLAQVNERLETALTGGGTASSLMGNKRFNELPTVEIYNKLKSMIDLDNRFDELIEREEAEREVIGKQYNIANKNNDNTGRYGWNTEGQERKDSIDITLSATPQAKALDGSYGGFQPKPAVEVIIVAMKPLSEKTFVDQALKNGKGITWLDNCRVPYESEKAADATLRANTPNAGSAFGGGLYAPDGEVRDYDPSKGRFPANLLVSDDVLNDGRDRHKSGNKASSFVTSSVNYLADKKEYKNTYANDSGSFSRYFDLDSWAQKTFPFLIVPKASKSERGQDCTHPTVKPIKLMSYLITLGSRAGDVVLDPFSGSGTTALACQLLNRKNISIEISEEYCSIAAKRLSQGVLELI